MTDYECPKCKEYKKVNDKLLERYLQLVAKVDPEIPDMTFTQQMDIILERLKKIFPPDSAGNLTIHIVKQKDPDVVPCITEATNKIAEKVTRITIYYRERIGE